MTDADRRALLAEARRWRRCAQLQPEAMYVLFWGYFAMFRRARQHAVISDHRLKPSKHTFPLACLLLALECEDEASGRAPSDGTP